MTFCQADGCPRWRKPVLPGCASCQNGRPPFFALSCGGLTLGRVDDGAAATGPGRRRSPAPSAAGAPEAATGGASLFRRPPERRAGGVSENGAEQTSVAVPRWRPDIGAERHFIPHHWPDQAHRNALGPDSSRDTQSMRSGTASSSDSARLLTSPNIILNGSDVTSRRDPE